MTALIEGFFGFVWFGWGQANASAGLSAGLAVAGVGAGTLLTVFGLAALAGVQVERTLQLSSPISS